MRLWRRDEDEKIKTTIMHLLHAAFAFGGLFAPVIARPYLAEFHFNSTINVVIDPEAPIGCSLNEDMIRDSEDNLNSLFYLLAILLLFITMLMALEWIFGVRAISLRPVFKLMLLILLSDWLKFSKPKFDWILAPTIQHQFDNASQRHYYLSF